MRVAITAAATAALYALQNGLYDALCVHELIEQAADRQASYKL